MYDLILGVILGVLIMAIREKVNENKLKKIAQNRPKRGRPPKTNEQDTQLGNYQQ